jgi:hypothetical protein
MAGLSSVSGSLAFFFPPIVRLQLEQAKRKKGGKRERKQRWESGDGKTESGGLHAVLKLSTKLSIFCMVIDAPPQYQSFDEQCNPYASHLTDRIHPTIDMFQSSS